MKHELFTLLGEVSMCWSPTPSGVFDSRKAEELGNKLLAIMPPDEQGMVEDFHDKHGISKHIPMRPSKASCEKYKVIADWLKAHAEVLLKSGDVHDQRVSLIAEEIGELFEALADWDEVKVFDAIIDSKYVLNGAAVLYDFPVAEGFKEVQKSNMSKKVSGDKRVRDKGPDYVPPNLKLILETHRCKR